MVRKLEKRVKHTKCLERGWNRGYDTREKGKGLAWKRESGSGTKSL